MKQIITKYSEEQINKFLVNLIEKLSDYSYIKYLKGQQGIPIADSLDILVLMGFKDIHEVEHFYSALNKRMSDSEKIPTFFRSTDNQSFLFPGGVNIHFADKKKFIKLMKTYKWNVYAILVEEDYVQLANSFIDKEKDGFFVILEKDLHRNKDIEFDRFWRK